MDVSSSSYPLACDTLSFMSRFAEKLRAGELAITLEITPPKKRLDEVLLRRARLLGGRADAINVIQRPGRISSLDASLILQKEGFNPVCHVVNRGRTRMEIRSELYSAASAGIGAVLCMRGDYPGEDASDTPRIRDVIALACEQLPLGLVGATANPYGPRDKVLANLIPKLRAGASFVQTHPVLELEALRPLGEEIKARTPDTRLVPMIMPLLSVSTALRIRDRLALLVPDRLLTRLEAGGERAGWDAFGETVAALAESPLVDGLSVMTAEMDPPLGSGERIAAVLSAVAEGI